MITLEDISIQFADRVLFADLSCLIGHHERMGFVGANGAGKTSLLKIMAGMVSPDTGSVSKAKYVSVGYLPQDGICVGGNTLYEEVESAFEEVIALREKLDEAHARLGALSSSSAECVETLAICGELQHRLEDLDAHQMESKVGRVLAGLGFAQHDFHRITDEFSGGWQMRIALAKLLLREPSVLLLDEPTNHLDIESQQWLEEYLQRYDGAVILVSHDRAFLDALCSRILVLAHGRPELYVGNYSFYEKEQAGRRQLRLSAYENQQRQIDQAQRFIDRFRAKATKASQVQSRVKQLEKIKRIEIEDAEAPIRFRFPPPPASGRVVMELQGIEKSYGENRVLEGVDLTIYRGDRIAVIGVNGAGKSTLARVLAGVEAIDAGNRAIGYNVMAAYFAQQQAEDLEATKQALQIVEEVAVGDTRKALRNILGAFLFHGDDVFKPVGVLSGGEKSRLALAKMLVQPSNFLLMDDPTNHLDMRSKDILQDALQNFKGTYVIVSHDRAFIDPIVSKVLEVRHDGVDLHLGNVSDYLHRKRMDEGNRKDSFFSGESGASAGRSLGGASEKERRRREAEQRQELSRTLKPLKERLRHIEESIAQKESRRTEIETLMAVPDFYGDGDTVRMTAEEYSLLKSRLEGEYEEWTEVSEKIGSIEPS